MSQTTMIQTCQCPCGASRLNIAATPLARFICHCTICQTLYQGPYADVNVFFPKDIAIEEDNKLQFKKYRLPPAVKRGHCTSCNTPVVGFLRLAPFVRIGFVASKTFPDQALLPKPAMHIFYHSRVADVNDGLPRYSGYWRSELALMSHLFSAIVHGSKPYGPE
jgi:hypothetical protein